MANPKSGTERYNDRMRKLSEDCNRIERESLKLGGTPNLNLTSPEEAKNYGWKLTGDTRAVRDRQSIEQTIARKIVDVLLAAGFLLGVNDGEETVVQRSRDKKAILDALFNTDEDYLYVYEDDDKNDPTNVLYDERPDYWVRLVYGNDGWDVMSDYSSVDHLDKYLGDGTEVQALIDKYSG